MGPILKVQNRSAIRAGVFCVFFLALAVQLTALASEPRPLVDAHIHYSHDAWLTTPPAKAIEILKKAGLKRAFVSSSSDQGTQMLYQMDSSLIVPVLRPYRKRGELSSWMHDETVLIMLSRLLDQNYYAGIGEFHAFGENIDLPVLRGVMDLAKTHGIFLHAHSDAAAVRKIFEYDADAIVLWAHSGFEEVPVIDEMLAAYPNLWADLAFRYEHEYDGQVDDDWRALFVKYPDRFLLGTDTYTPERWYYVIDHADQNRLWLENLPEEIAANIAWRNAERLLEKVKR